METTLNDKDIPAFRITFSKEALSEEQLWENISKAKWTIKTKEGEIMEVDPKFGFDAPGVVIK